MKECYLFQPRAQNRAIFNNDDQVHQGLSSQVLAWICWDEGLRFHSLSWKPVPMFAISYSENIFIPIFEFHQNASVLLQGWSILLNHVTDHVLPVCFFLFAIMSHQVHLLCSMAIMAVISYFSYSCSGYITHNAQQSAVTGLRCIVLTVWKHILFEALQLLKKNNNLT